MSLCMERRGTQQSSTNIDNHLVLMKFLLPLNEIVVDFHDQLKSVSSGYASFDYEEYGFVPSKLVKVSSITNCFKIKNTQFLPLGNATNIPEPIMYFVTREKILISNFHMFWMFYAFLWVIPRHLNFICQRFGTLCLFHLHRQVGVKNGGQTQHQKCCLTT